MSIDGVLPVVCVEAAPHKLAQLQRSSSGLSKADSRETAVMEWHSSLCQLEPDEDPPTLSMRKKKPLPDEEPLQGNSGEGLQITLAKPGGEMRTVTAMMQPLGMVFQRVPPFRVNKVEPNGHVKDLGITVGWELKRVGTVELRWLTLVEAEADLAAARQAIATLPVRIPMVLQPHGSRQTQTVVLTSAPLGMDFNPQPPFNVTHVTALSHAEKLGVRKEWLVKRVGIVELREGADVLQALALLKLLPSDR